MPSTTDTREPAQVFLYDRPVQGGPSLSEEMRNNFRALAQTFYGTDAANPVAPRIGQFRVLREEPPAFAVTNVKVQWFDGAVWRTLLQGIEGGIPAPTKLIVDITAPLAVWTIDHNLGSFPLVQVLNASGQEMVPFNVASGNVREMPVARLSSVSLVAIPAGPAFSSRVALPVGYEGTILSAHAAVDEPTLGGPFTVDFSIGGTPITGGTITVPASAAGVVIQGAAVTALNIFTAGQTIDVLVTTPAPITAGAIDVFLVLARTLNPGEYILQHATDNRVVITHPAPQDGKAVILG